MNWSALVTRRTTSGERTVLVWTLVVLFVVIGGLAFYFSTLTAKPDVAAQLRSIAYWSFALAVIVFVIRKVVTYFIEH